MQIWREKYNKSKEQEKKLEKETIKPPSAPQENTSNSKNLKKKSAPAKKDENEENKTSNNEKNGRWNVGPDREKVCIIFFNMLEAEAKKNEGAHAEEKLVELAGSIEQGLFF